MTESPDAHHGSDEWNRLEQAQAGDESAWDEVVQRHRARLRRMVELRMHPRLQGRVDASDIIQDTFVEAARVLKCATQNTDLPVHLWLRRLANQKLIQAHREHLDAACRAAEREQAAHASPQASSYSIAGLLIGNVTSPSNAAVRGEQRRLLEAGLEQMDPLDREVLVLRHFEQLTGPESAEIMGISHDAVKKRYIRALEKLRNILSELGVTGESP